MTYKNKINNDFQLKTMSRSMTCVLFSSPAVGTAEGNSNLETCGFSIVDEKIKYRRRVSWLKPQNYHIESRCEPGSSTASPIETDLKVANVR